MRPFSTALLAAAALSLAGRAVAQLPALSIQQPGSDVLLSWPVSATGWVLQSSTQPGTAGSWANVPGSAAVQGGQLVWTNTFPPGIRFFRLAEFGPLPVPTNAQIGRAHV